MYIDFLIEETLFIKLEMCPKDWNWLEIGISFYIAHLKFLNCATIENQGR